MYNWNLLNFQDYNSYMMILLVEFHDLILLILIMIIMYIFYILIWFMFNNLVNKNILHNHLIELIWTIIPIFILLFMVIPSLKILYLIEDFFNCLLTFKIMGHQWYWSYEFMDFENLMFDSFMYMNFNKINLIRLLDVDNHLILPFGFNIRGLVSSFDVIHSWALPVMGVKVDAIPGRINQFIMILDRLGLFYGQCSEICGLNHSFMPIILESVNLNLFMNYLMEIKNII